MTESGNSYPVDPLRRQTIPTRTIAEVGVVVALAAVLHFVKVWEAPQGGSVSLEMLPIFFIAFRRGAGVGILTGTIFGLINLVLKPYVVTPVQFILDYPLAFGALGVAGCFARNVNRADGRVSVPFIMLGVLAGTLLRFVSHLLSGVVFFAQYAPKGQSPWAYSAIYNAWYLVPEAVITAAVLWWFARRKDVFGRGLH